MAILWKRPKVPASVAVQSPKYISLLVHQVRGEGMSRVNQVVVAHLINRIHVEIVERSNK